MIFALCGMQNEAGVIPPSDVIKVFVGTDGAAQLRQEEQIPDALISFGTCGGLRQGILPGALVLATEVRTAAGRVYKVDAPWWQALMKAALGLHLDYGLTVTSGPLRSAPGQIIIDQKARMAAYAASGCIVDDEESWVVAELAQQRNVPFVVIRGVSDGIDTVLPPFVDKAISPDGSTDLRVIIDALGKDPSQIGDLFVMGHSGTAALNAVALLYRVNPAIFQRIF